MSTTTVGSPTTATILEQALQQLVQQGQQNNQLLSNLANELAVMNRQLFHDRAGTLMAPYPQPLNGNGYQPNGSGQAGPQSVQARKIERGTCAEVGVSKTRSLNKWKVIFYMYGIRKPAAVYGHGGYKELVRFMAQVWPEISDGHFSEELFNQRNKEVRDSNPDATYVARYTIPEPFVVEFYDSEATELADGRKMSFRYAERVSPCQAEATA